MKYDIVCSCGKVIAVSDGLAGTSVACSCGRAVAVPPLSELRNRAVDKKPPEQRGGGEGESNRIVLWIVGALVFAAICMAGGRISLSAGRLSFFAYLAAVVGQIWLLVLIVRECDPGAVFFALVIPFFSWYFAFKRWDIAKLPFFLSITGYLICILAAWGWFGI